jgi:hypothetical protein
MQGAHFSSGQTFFSFFICELVTGGGRAASQYFFCMVYYIGGGRSVGRNDDGVGKKVKNSTLQEFLTRPTKITYKT